MNKYMSGLPETSCGEGSKLENTVGVREILPLWIKEYSIKTMFDAGCGDRNWIKHIDLGCEYSCGDLPEYNMLTDPMPYADLVLCRDVLIHMTKDEILSIEWNCKYLATTFFQPKTHDNIPDYPGITFIDLNFEEEPFNWNPPIDAAKDYSPGKFLGLWKM